MQLKQFLMDCHERIVVPLLPFCEASEIIADQPMQLRNVSFEKPEQIIVIIGNELFPLNLFIANGLSVSVENHAEV
jgi:hypothetical protein